jgi:hypothetical protein
MVHPFFPSASPKIQLRIPWSYFVDTIARSRRAQPVLGERNPLTNNGRLFPELPMSTKM